MEAPSEAIDDSRVARECDDLENVFFANYQRVVRLVGRVIRDPGRAEELAVEAFLRLPRGLAAEVKTAWLCRTAARLGLDELRRQRRGELFAGMLRVFQRVPTPEELHQSREEQDRVREALRGLAARDAEMLVLRSEGLSYAELGTALGLNAASIGTLLARAQKSFRKEYIKRYGTRE